MDYVTATFFWGYAFMLVTVGASGIFVARWELARVFAIPLASLSAPTRATILNQYRFLKAVELAFGIFCIRFHSEIFELGAARQVFLSGAALAVFARLWSTWRDGRPHRAFTVFAALEFMTALLIALNSGEHRSVPA
jgi:hypothetical protein